MSSRTEDRRAALQEKLIALAEETISEKGLTALKARDLATRAGCSVGAIYTVFPDLDALVVAVNGRTFHALATQVAEDLAKAGRVAPVEQLVLLGHAYLDFATAHPRLWRSLFDVALSVEDDVPDWYMKDMGTLFAFIANPLSAMHPDATKDEIALLTRTLFSSVHGIVLLGVEKRISAVPHDHLRPALTALLRNATSLRFS